MSLGVELPDDIILPAPRDKQEEELYRVLNDYFTQLRQSLIEINDKAS